jgi:hypothetical protein
MTAKERLTQALRDALQAAQDADPGPNNDGGSCNLDKVTLRVDRMQLRTITACAQAAGVSCYISTWWGRKRAFLGFNEHGQASRRYTMVQAADKSLRASGYMPLVYYRID